ncbi:MAG: hypothetical protein LW817_04070 [Candidatus Caenarcaniphilales bacterium]|jgi:beta-N-acetylhexosaminidase|nr:hypothetical protein [Candidatus Caenarcaniphilales bacterium]
MSFEFSKRFIVGFDSLRIDSGLRKKLSDLNPAGIIFYDANIESKSQFIDLIKDLQDTLGDKVLLTTDQEGGKVQRLRKITSALPSLESLQTLDDVAQHSHLLASELKALGINLVFAPCADLNCEASNPIIGSRSFGADPELVSKKVSKMIQVYQEYNLQACAKHYPGHGDASIDSHLALPRVSRTTEEIQKHIMPFEAAIEAGVESIMIAHLVVNDSVLPASLDANLISDLRRKFLDGLIISDEITMKALSPFGDYNQLSHKLLEAGNDLIIWNTNIDDALKAAQYLDDKALDLSEHQKTLTRIIECKNKITTKIDLDFVSPYQDAMLDIARRSIKIKNSNFDKWKKIPGDFLLLKTSHPKLEAEYIEQGFFRHSETRVAMSKNLFDLRSFASLRMTESLTDADFVDLTKILLLSFQAKPEEILLIQKLRDIYQEKLLVVSCDIDEKFSDIRIPGANLVHYLSFSLEA